jgi:hypothetical protein
MRWSAAAARWQRALRFPRTRLGRVIRDILRKIAGSEEEKAGTNCPVHTASGIAPVPDDWNQRLRILVVEPKNSRNWLCGR